ncbi:pyridoxamine 5'-phosphate oxidase family protein [Parendozoicomonas haliclonae]|uniref:Pyridoxamine 5'-phosphate oxidase n=1 Tax=Parendozoicomonas haliclonae TaxID=1960125 RepID=A0A1X7AJ29_9GAMM|nr:pyridoxamine 5'-phosphate oxidase family protein [Parendozoicomonas haliclonae]SMA45414.1 Pyridoxamine 5'-phosphate oxidase [Parendozoicomonas haliclonae]
MGKLHTEITDEQQAFIERQQIFFVGTAATEGSVNISPKGIDSFRVINPNRVAWLNLTGSGNETSAHVQLNPRMTIMFCAFEGQPLILRLYGQARVLHQQDKDWQKYFDLFPDHPGTRQIFVVDIERTQNSCGKAVPLYDYVAQREGLLSFAERRGQQGIEEYWEQTNQTSLDGFPTNIVKRSGIEKK